MSIMTCTNCGSQWDTETTPRMAFFNNRNPTLSAAMTSPAEILAAGKAITFCPRCPMPRLDEAMKRDFSGGGDRGRKI